MTITNRLSLFFLLALAVVLVGFSGTMYALADWHLHTQLDHRLASAMEALVAAIEVHPGDVEWEPMEREVMFGKDDDLSHSRWLLHDEHGKLIDCSINLQQISPPYFADSGRWRLMSCWLRAGNFKPELTDVSELQKTTGSPAELPKDRTALRQGFLMTLGFSEEPVYTALRNLALAMIFVSTLIWLTAAACTRWLCRRALLPVTQMAATARELRNEPESELLLTVPRTDDEVAELGQAFNELLESLRESLEQQRRFAGDASHQLRTPLTALLAAVDVAARHERSATEYQRILKVVQHRGRDLQQIVEVLLSISRNEPSAALTKRETIDLKNWCANRIKESWQEHARAGDLEIDPASQHVLLETQPILVAQIFDNLLDNACKYSEPGSVITISTTPRDGNVVLGVRDHGPGIPPDDITRVFEPFFRSTQARWLGTPGTGLGLTVAHRLASLLGGQLKVDSTPGQGSLFQLILPAVGQRTEASNAAALAEKR